MPRNKAGHLLVDGAGEHLIPVFDIHPWVPECCISVIVERLERTPLESESHEDSEK